MLKLNVFVDGTWLFYQCGASHVLANATESPTSRFNLNFGKLNRALLAHVGQAGGSSTPGCSYFVTSIFQLPGDLDDWQNQYIPTS